MPVGLVAKHLLSAPPIRELGERRQIMVLFDDSKLDSNRHTMIEPPRFYAQINLLAARPNEKLEDKVLISANTASDL